MKSCVHASCSSLISSLCSPLVVRLRSTPSHTNTNVYSKWKSFLAFGMGQFHHRYRTGPAIRAVLFQRYVSCLLLSWQWTHVPFISLSWYLFTLLANTSFGCSSGAADRLCQLQPRSCRHTSQVESSQLAVNPAHFLTIHIFQYTIQPLCVHTYRHSRIFTPLGMLLDLQSSTRRFLIRELWVTYNHPINVNPMCFSCSESITALCTENPSFAWSWSAPRHVESQDKKPEPRSLILSRD